MNVGGGEAADQLVRMMLSGGEVAVRLGGSAIKNLLALTMALAHNRKILSGKVNMGKMLKETRDLRRFPMTPKQYKHFKRLAKKYKLLFSVIRDKDDHGKLRDVILPVTELDRANAIFERILYTLPAESERNPERPLQQGRKVFQRSQQVPEKEVQAPEQAETAVSRQRKAPQRLQIPSKEQRRQQPVPARQGSPVAQHQMEPPKKESRSGRGSHDTRTSFSTPQGQGTMTKHPSVEGRLKAYRVQLEQRSIPARQKTKTKSRPKTR